MGYLLEYILLYRYYFIFIGLHANVNTITCQGVFFQYLVVGNVCPHINDFFECLL